MLGLWIFLSLLCLGCCIFCICELRKKDARKRDRRPFMTCACLLALAFVICLIMAFSEGGSQSVLDVSVRRF